MIPLHPARHCAFLVRLVLCLFACSTARLHAVSDADILRGWQERHVFVTGQIWQFPLWPDGSLAPVMPGDDYAVACGESAIQGIYNYAIGAGTDFSPMFVRLPDFYLTSTDVEGIDILELADLRVSRIYRPGLSAAQNSVTGRREFVASLVMDMSTAIRPLTLKSPVRRAWYDLDFGQGEIPAPNQTMNWNDTVLFRSSASGFQESAPPAPAPQSNVSFINGRLEPWSNPTVTALPHMPMAGDWKLYVKPATLNTGAFKFWFADYFGSLNRLHLLESNQIEWPLPKPNSDPSRIWSYPTFTDFGASLGRLLDPVSQPFLPPGSNASAVTNNSALLLLDFAIGVTRPSFRYLPGAGHYDLTAALDAARKNCRDCMPGAAATGESPSASITAGTVNPDGDQPTIDFDPGATVPAPAGDLTPDKLRLPETGNGTSIIRRLLETQIVTPEAVTQVSSPEQRVIRLLTWPKSATGAPEFDGWRPAPISGQPQAMNTIRQPNPGTMDGVSIESVQGSRTTVTTWTWQSATSTWLRTSEQGQTDFTLAVTPANNLRDVLLVSRSPAGVVTSNFRRSAIPTTRGWRVTQEIIDPAGAALATTSSYYSKTDGNAISGQLKSVIRPDGSFSRYTYDSRGRQTRIESSLGDSAFDDPGAALRVSDFVYFDSNPVTAGLSFTYNPGGSTAWPGKASETRESAAGTPVARSARIEWRETAGINVTDCVADVAAVSLNANAEAQFRTGGVYKTLAALRAEGCLVTVTKTPGSGPFRGLPVSVQKPDGTLTLTSYATTPPGVDATSADQLETTTDTGAANGAGTAVVDGTHTVSLANRQRRVIAETVTDIASGRPVSSRFASATDDFGRVLGWTHGDGTTESFVYDCCGLVSSTDQTGLVTNYPLNNTVAGGGVESSVVTPLIYTDGAGAPHSSALTITTRTEGLATLTRRTGGDGSVIETDRTVKDAAGRITQKSDALQRTASFAETYIPIGSAPPSGSPDNRPRHRIRTTVNPDGGTVIEEFAADGKPLRVSGTAVHALRYEYGLSSPGAGYPALPFTRTIRLRPDSGQPGQLTDSAEFSTAWTDAAGRPLVTITSAGAASWTFYDNAGRVSRTIDPDGVSTLFAYDGRSHLTVTAIDMDRDGVIDFDGADRITRTVVSRVNDPVRGDVERTVTSVWATDNTDSAAVISVEDKSADGRRSWLDADGLTTHTATVLQGGGNRIETVTAPDQTSVVTAFTAGRKTLTENRDSAGTPAGSAATQYDAHGRVLATIDARNGATVNTYFADDRIASVTAPAPGDVNGNPAGVTAFTYDAAGRTDVITLPGHTVAAPQTVDTDYLPTGEISAVSGTRTRRTAQTRDYAGRLTALTTFQSAASSQTTSWIYDPQSGFLLQELSANGSGPSYTRTSAGRVLTRAWARTAAGQPVLTTYGYDASGALTDQTYSDATPSVHRTLDRLGRAAVITDASGRRSLTLSPSGRLLSEAITSSSGSPSHLAGASFTNNYDGLRRRASWIGSLADSTITHGFGYNLAGRLAWAEQGSLRASHFYDGLSGLIDHINWKESGVSRLVQTRVCDHLNRLQTIENVNPGSGYGLTFAAVYDAAGRRIGETTASADSWAFAYNDAGDLTSAGRSRNGEPVPGQQFTWQYDEAGNRIAASRGDTPVQGSHAETAAYSPGVLNQPASRTHPAALNVTGIAHSDALVTVNGEETARTALGLSDPGQSIFHARLAVDNSGNAPVVLDVEIAAAENAVTETETRRTLIRPGVENFTYDPDGNLIQDALYDYTWDAENRLVRIQSRSNWPFSGASVPLQRLDFAWDSEGRRIRQQAWLASPDHSGGWIPSHDRRQIYDGSRLCAEVDPDGTLYRSFLWSDEGGLLAVSIRSAAPANTAALPASSVHLPALDTSSSVRALIAADDHFPGSPAGAETARYDYDPFGDLLAADGPAALLNQIGWRSSVRDPETGLLQTTGGQFYAPANGVSLGLPHNAE